MHRVRVTNTDARRSYLAPKCTRADNDPKMPKAFFSINQTASFNPILLIVAAFAQIPSSFCSPPLVRKAKAAFSLKKVSSRPLRQENQSRIECQSPSAVYLFLFVLPSRARAEIAIVKKSGYFWRRWLRSDES